MPDRMDPVYAAWKFFDALSKVRGWRELAPTIAIHRVQINADPNHYARYETPARAVLAAIPDLRKRGVIMADPMDIIEVPWQPGNYARRALVDAVARAGKPWGNSWGRLKAEQQRAWDKYQNGTGSPADDPNRPNSFPLAHVRFVAVDVDATADNVRRLLAAGLVRPYSNEPWHFQLPGSVYKWPLVDSIPSTASSDAQPFEEDDMFTDEDRARIQRIDADNQQIKAWLRGDQPDVDRLTEAMPILRELYARIRGANPDVDNVQNIEGQSFVNRELLEKILAILSKNNAG